MLRMVLIMALLLGTGMTAMADWAPAGDKIKTRWAKDVDPNNPLPEYPRPIMARDAWVEPERSVELRHYGQRGCYAYGL